MLTAFYVHMINIRSTYDLHASYIDYCWMFVGVNIVSFFNMFDCIGIGSFIVAAIGLNTSLGIDSFRWHCFTMPHYPDDHKMWCGNIPPALTMAVFMSIVLHSFGFSIRSFRWHCVFFLMPHAYRPPTPLGNVIWVGTGRVVVIDGVNIGSFLQHVGSYQSQGCRYRCCKYWNFSSTCLIFFVALFLLLILYCCSDLAQDDFFNR